MHTDTARSSLSPSCLFFRLCMCCLIVGGGVWPHTNGAPVVTLVRFAGEVVLSVNFSVTMEAAAVISAAGVGACSLVLATIALWRGGTSQLIVPATAKCFVAGLLCALGLLVMLPAALYHLPSHESPERVLHFFFAAPLLMFFVHHILLDHQHGDVIIRQPIVADGSAELDAEAGCVCHSPVKEDAVSKAGAIVQGRRPLFNNMKGFNQPQFCTPVKTPLAKSPPPPPSPPPTKLATVLSGVAVLLRALPYTIHAFVDGALLGSAHSAVVLASLVTCVSLCAVQDVGTIILSLSASGATRRAKLVTVGCFALGFPLGTIVTVAAVDGASSVAFQQLLRAFAAGVFVYMALFEMAPAHAHGRLANIRYLCAFAGGVVLVLLSEAAEGWAVGAISADVGGAPRTAAAASPPPALAMAPVTAVVAPVMLPVMAPVVEPQGETDVAPAATTTSRRSGGFHLAPTSMSLQPSVA